MTTDPGDAAEAEVEASAATETPTVTRPEVSVSADADAGGGGAVEPLASQSSAGARPCPTCGENAPIDAKWCEACGNDLDAMPKKPCVSCDAPATEVTDDGWCQLCGTKQPAPGDHVVADHGWFAIVSDRGRAHRVNEDAGAVAARPSGVVLVVCDGVSSTDESQNASQVAAAAVAEPLAQATWSRIEPAAVDAAQHAQQEIMAVSDPASTEPPSCTLVAAAAEIAGAQAQVAVFWLGDSRAYWLHDGTARQLSVDHSWATEQGALGELDADTIAADPRAGSITRWLGADSPDVTPQSVTMTVDLPGSLLVCSDGLWNYARTEPEIAAVFEAGPSRESVIDQAERLVAFANERGGHDNITVAIARLEPSARPTEPTSTGEPHG